MDDDDIAKPYQIGALARALEMSGAAALAPFLDHFTADGVPNQVRPPRLPWPPGGTLPDDTTEAPLRREVAGGRPPR